jgi:phage terminase large subunit
MSKITVPIDWKPRPYQLPLWKYMEGGGKRAVAVWHRRAGKDLSSINWCAVSALTRPGLYWHLFPTYNQGRKIAWDGMTRDGRKFLEHFPKEMWEAVNNTEMRLTLKNGSIYQVVGTDNVDRLVGANPVGVVFSEYSLQDPRAWDYIRPILAENGGWALFIYTARGRNHGYDLLNVAKKNENWFQQVLSVEDTRAIPLSAIDEERASGMPEEMIQQEFYCSFDAPLVGSYYGNAMARLLADRHLTKVPYEPLLDVHTAWDLGVGDSTSIIFYQLSGAEIRIIDYYEMQGEGLAHYAKVLREKEYVYGEHLAPHDIQVRDFSTGKSRLEAARELGIRFRVVPNLRVDDGIEAVRNTLPKCYFDENKCAHLIEALRQYRKDYDEKRQVFRDRPLHDWTSHPSDAMRYLALGVRQRTDKRMSKLPRQAEGEYSIFDAY